MSWNEAVDRDLSMLKHAHCDRRKAETQLSNVTHCVTVQKPHVEPLPPWRPGAKSQYSGKVCFNLMLPYAIRIGFHCVLPIMLLIPLNP